MPVEVKSRDLRLKEKLMEITSYVSSVVILSNFIVINFTKFPTYKRDEILTEINRAISLFTRADCKLFKESPELKSWTFTVGG